MNNDLPFYFLNIDFSISDDWKKISKNVNMDRVVHVDENASLLGKQTRQIINEAGIDISFAYVWSWPQSEIPEYHTDAPYGVAQSAINTLLQGDSAVTQWIRPENAVRYSSHTEPGVQEGAVLWRSKSGVPDFKLSLSPNKPVLIRLDIPHVVDTTNVKQLRWCYSIRMNKKNTQESLTWVDAKKLLLK